MKYWGVYREREHSPEREFDDAEILRLTGARLSQSGDQVTLFSPEELPAASGDAPDVIFVMCERRSILARLQSWADLGVIVINSPSAIRNTYRDRTLSRLHSAPATFRSVKINFPESRIVKTTAPDSINATARHARPARQNDGPLWIKRGDVHCTQAGDVVLARTENEISNAMAQLRGRGIETAVMQQHIPGDLTKFYGVIDHGSAHYRHGPAHCRMQNPDNPDNPDNPANDESWFRWFYHRDQILAGHGFDESRLMDAARLAARALELEIFGGDAIVDAAGEIWIIDVNAWPAFALYREEASEQIARLISARVTRAERSERSERSVLVQAR